MTLARQLDGKTFVPLANDHGLASGETRFRYRVENDLVSGTYQGGAIIAGGFLGKVVADDRIELLFHCQTEEQQLLAGWSRGVVRRGANGLFELEFVWGWGTGSEPAGTSAYRELAEPA